LGTSWTRDHERPSLSNGATKSGALPTIRRTHSPTTPRRRVESSGCAVRDRIDIVGVAERADGPIISARALRWPWFYGPVTTRVEPADRRRSARRATSNHASELAGGLRENRLGGVRFTSEEYRGRIADDERPAVPIYFRVPEGRVRRAMPAIW
jgi:hypothetical protein